MKKALRIHNSDNVAVALEDFKEGETVLVGDMEIKVKENIPRGHKFALSDIKEGENAIKYGFPIGHAAKNISVGEFIHTHNLKTNLQGKNEYSFCKKYFQNDFDDRHLTFKGYKRKSGEIGIRNELWIIPTVGCVNQTSEKIMEAFKKRHADLQIDNTLVLKHSFGCSQLGDDLEMTRKILAGTAKHPNAGGVLVLGLGCENNTIEGFKKALGDYDVQRIKFLSAQDVSDEIEKGAELLDELYSNMKNDVKEHFPLSKLKVGLKCGGSDGFSGITANPLLGRFADFLTAQGGTVVLTEVPEMFGAETMLMERAQNEEIFSKIVNLVNGFKEYFMSYGQPVYENPSPGNKAGGITTLEEKSLGCTQKAGTAEVTDVLDYGEIIKKNGLNLLKAPGNDLVASSALASAGCQLILFTTGRGTPFGTYVPTVKISTNSELFRLKPHWIDFDAGKLLNGADINDILEDFINAAIEFANGKKTKNEINDFREIAIFKTGVTL